MQDDFFQVLRRVQKEERNKSSLSRVGNDFYKQLRDYIKNLEQSVARDPFGNEQLLLNNAQRIATEICEQRESKITKAANNNIYRSFLLFKKDNPQFDLLDTTPLNLTDEEETLYFSLMDALKNHRYRISLDEYTDEGTDGFKEDYEEDYEEGYDEDDEDYEGEKGFVEDSYQSSQSSESETSIGDDLEDEISNALGGSDEPVAEASSTISEGSDEVLDRLNQIKNAKVITDEKYENIDRQVANQKYPSQSIGLDTLEDSSEDVYVEDDSQFEIETPEIKKESGIQTPDVKGDIQTDTQETKEEVQSSEEGSKRESFGSNINDIYKNPDSQFVDLDKLEPNYEDDYYNAIAAGSDFAQPSEDDFNLIFAKPKKPKAPEESKGFTDSKVPADSMESAESAEPKVETPLSPKSRQSELGFSSGLDVKEKKDSSVDLNKPIQKSEDVPKKPVDKTKGGIFAKDEIENTTVIISENINEIVGIDGKVYGPFLENDVVILPNITAQILINNNKATLLKS